MKKIVFRIICIVLVFASSGCGVSQYASIQRKTSLDGYKYFTLFIQANYPQVPASFLEDNTVHSEVPQVRVSILQMLLADI